MFPDVRTDAALLITLLDEKASVLDRQNGHLAQITVKTLSRWTGLSDTTISLYRMGQANIPISFWRRILEHHIDARIIALLTPVDCSFDLNVNSIDGPASAPEFFREAVKVAGEHHETMKYVAEMLADGRIDEMDSATVQAYYDSFQSHRLRESALHQAIITTYNRQAEAKAQAARRSQ